MRTKDLAKRAERKIQENTVDLGLLDDGTVIIQFGTLLKQMTFTPEQARSLGLGFIEMATRADGMKRLQGKIGAHNLKTRH